MKTAHLRTKALSGAAVTALAAGLVLAFPGAAGADATSPAPAITQDPNASGGSITFYDAKGAVETSGKDLSRIFDYAEASSAGRAGTTKATAYFAFPDHTKADSKVWFKKQVTASTVYPNSSAPAPVNSSANPVAFAGDAGADLGGMLPTTTQDGTDGYKGIVQVRLYDSGPGIQQQSSPFWATDIYYDASANTWQQVFPAVQQATNTTTELTVSPASPTAKGSDLTLKAVVSPAADGTVQFSNGSTTVGSPVTVVSGVATTTVPAAAVGNYAFSAVFTPADTTAFNGSTSNTVNEAVADVPSAPSSVKATAGNASATVSWTAPSSNNSDITAYSVQYQKAGDTTWTPVERTGTATTQTVAGLTNGTSYTFRVAAVNAIGMGAYTVSNPVTPVVPLHSTSLTIAGGKTITYGQSATITGTLKDTTANAALAGKSVTLKSRTSTSKPFATVKTVTTSKTGGLSLSVKPGSTTQYEWVYAGDATHKAATSSIATITVKQSVTIAVDHGSVKHGATVRIYGVVGPAVSGRVVTLQQQSGSTWKTLKITTKVGKKTLPNGKTTVGYILFDKITAKGTFHFRVLVSAATGLASNTSGSVTVKSS